MKAPSPDEPIVVESIAQVHQIAMPTPPKHPLISVIGASWQPPLQIQIPLMQRRIISQLYSVSLKQGNECGLKYGRNFYDFSQGSLLCIAPGQSVVPVTEPSDLESDHDGWTLMFHPDLLRDSPLAARMKQYTFFGYDSHEALHLSAEEEGTLTGIVRKIEAECAVGDEFSDELLLGHLQLFLSYCQRYYGRQFSTRAGKSLDVIARLEQFLAEYFRSERPSHEGLPTVQACAKAMGYSADYLSDLLRNETGKNTREHIHQFLIEEAKNRLFAREQSVSEIAFGLGFEQPQHFSKLFKSKTGVSPGAYRR